MVVRKRNVSHSSMDLKTWSLVGGNVWRVKESLGGRAFLEEACQGERASRVYSLTWLFASCMWAEMRFLNFLLWTPGPAFPAIISSLFGTRSQSKCFLPWVGLDLVIVLHQHDSTNTPRERLY